MEHFLGDAGLPQQRQPPARPLTQSTVPVEKMEEGAVALKEEECPATQAPAVGSGRAMSGQKDGRCYGVGLCWVHCALRFVGSTELGPLTGHQTVESAWQCSANKKYVNLEVGNAWSLRKQVRGD